MVNETVSTSLTDTTGQLPQVGTDVGTFLENLAPGVVNFIFILAIVSAIIGLFGAIIFVIRRALQ